MSSHKSCLSVEAKVELTAEQQVTAIKLRYEQELLTQYEINEERAHYIIAFVRCALNRPVELLEKLRSQTIANESKRLKRTPDQLLDKLSKINDFRKKVIIALLSKLGNINVTDDTLGEDLKKILDQSITELSKIEDEKEATKLIKECVQAALVQEKTLDADKAVSLVNTIVEKVIWEPEQPTRGNYVDWTPESQFDLPEVPVDKNSEI